MTTANNNNDGTFRRIVLIVLDSVGVGAMPDAEEYDGHRYSNTLGNTAKAVGGLELPHLEALGLGNLTEVKGVSPRRPAKGLFGKAALAAPNKDTTSGHWEMMGCVLKRKLPVYPRGFPEDLLEKFIKETGVPGVLGNLSISGTEVIKLFGDEHIKTGKPIVYTSADSVFQIAAHEEAFGLKRLYDVCEKARSLLRGEHEVGRVIARPFLGENGHFTRTANRRDYSLLPPSRTVLDELQKAGIPSLAVGKICDIFAGRGIKDYVKTRNNADGIRKTLLGIDSHPEGLIFTNLVDFDMLYGHRNNPQGYAGALEEFDNALPRIQEVLGEDDLLLLCSDHGNDPTTPGTDHSREYCLILGWSPRWREGKDVGLRRSLADIGATVSENFGLPILAGESFLRG
ncbi:MAG: phosphopentomutase [Candidatus Hydrogenedentota bacterium]|nr:MAG: phosphopentomutase [Candidatus Hydrogenedentota bacterium]